MTPGLTKDIWCHVWPYSFLCLQITRSDTRPHAKWAVSLVIADGHLIFLSGFCWYVWVNRLTINPKGTCGNTVQEIRFTENKTRHQLPQIPHTGCRWLWLMDPITVLYHDTLHNKTTKQKHVVHKEKYYYCCYHNTCTFLLQHFSFFLLTFSKSKYRSKWPQTHLNDTWGKG